MSIKSKAVYITDASMQLVRGNEPLSPRVNQVFERYEKLLSSGMREVAASVAPGDLEAIRNVFRAPDRRLALELQIVELMSCAYDVSHDCGAAVTQLSLLGQITLMEQLEAHRILADGPAPGGRAFVIEAGA